jgi:transcriptional regulator with XRE-family HTH domain
VENTVGQNIKKYRILAGLTQKELAEALGKKAMTIMRYESGRIFPPIPVLDEIAKIFDVNTNSLMSERDSETKDFLEMNSFGENLKNIRLRKKLKQSDLSKISGVGVSTISLIENNTLKPRAGTIKKLADALEIPLKTLIGDYDSQTFEDEEQSEAAFENARDKAVKNELDKIFNNLSETGKKRLIETARDLNKLYRLRRRASIKRKSK